MKNFVIFFTILIIVLVACENKKKVEKPVDDFLKVSTYAATPPAPAERIIYVDRATKEIVTDSTYWFVVATANNVNWHGTVVLKTPYFDFGLARKEFEETKGKLYFKFILQITKESCRSFEHYNE
jgi:hypothetical protein